MYVLLFCLIFFSIESVFGTSWKETQFKNFLPVYINKRHGKKALDLAETIILRVYSQETDRGENVEFKWDMALHFLSKLMNTMVCLYMVVFCTI